MSHTQNTFIDYVKTLFVEKQPRVLLDIGSHNLDQSIVFAEIFPNTRIIAVEPNPVQYKICLDKASKYKNIEVHNFAISDVGGTADFWVVDGNPGGSSLLEPISVPYSTNKWTKISVECVRLDDLLKKIGVNEVDVVWIDVQGHELSALKSLGSLINSVKAIHTEACPNPYYKGHTPQSELEEFLNQNNFAFRFIPAPHHPFGEGDLICIRK